jgi:hypothetical protein
MVAFGIFPVFIASMLLPLPAILSVRDKIPTGRQGSFNESGYIGHESSLIFNDIIIEI